MAESKESLVKSLEELLGNVFSMYVRAHGAHWNVRGSDFAQYHELFGEIYEDVYGSIDALAENIRKLDADAPASLNEFNKLDGLAEAPVSGQSEQVLTQDIVNANRVVLESLFDAFKIANDENQQGIANFLAERIDMHQKWNWQLTASMEKEASPNLKDAPITLSIRNCPDCEYLFSPDDQGICPNCKSDEWKAAHPNRDILDTVDIGNNVRPSIIREIVDLVSQQDYDEDESTRRSSISVKSNSLIMCAACGEDEACQGHALEVDPIGYSILANHKVDDHLSCHPSGCKVAGRSLHAHTCMNCGELAACTAKMASAVCEERNTICSNCLPKLARIEHIGKGGIKERMRLHTNGGEYDNVSEELIDLAVTEGRTLDSVRRTHGPHRPVEKGAAKEESSDSFVPPSSVASAAKRGLELRRKHNRGGTEIGVARARDLSNRKGLSYKTVKRMKAYFDRHEVDKKGEGWGKDSAGYIAWLLWGGDSGRAWANKIVKQKEKKKKQSSVGLLNTSELPKWITDAIDYK